MGTKTVKWELGQKMLVKAVMDQELYDMIDNNIYIAGFPDSYVDVITDRNGVTVRPCHSCMTASPVYICCLLFQHVLGHHIPRRNCIHHRSTNYLVLRVLELHLASCDELPFVRRATVTLMASVTSNPLPCSLAYVTQGERAIS